MRAKHATLLYSVVATVGLAATTLAASPANADTAQSPSHSAGPAVTESTMAAGRARAAMEDKISRVKTLAGSSYAGSERLTDGTTQIAVAANGPASSALVKAAQAAGVTLKQIRYNEDQLSA